MTVDHDPVAPSTEAGVASAETGSVILDGPDGIAATIQPDAAEETGKRLIAAAAQAREQSSSSD